MEKNVTFGKFSFPNKKACIIEAQHIISTYSENQLLTTNDKAFFEALFTLHSEYDEKVGVGIRDIQVQLDQYKNKCLCIVRLDETKTVISWRHCIQPHSTKNIISYAFRRAVKHSIIDFKKETIAKGAICPIESILLDFYNSHASYVGTSFDDLISAFLSQNELTYADIDLVDPDEKDKDQRGIIKDPNILRDWKDYHETNAFLELRCAQAKLSKNN